jgi:hypothetical protein
MVLVREALHSLLLAKVTVVPDFNSGLEEVFEQRPQVVFIQHEIAGVTGEMVSRTIKALLQANSPRFIHLGRSVGDTVVSRDYDDCINLDLSDADLVELFRRHLMALPAFGWKEQTPNALETVSPETVSGNAVVAELSETGSAAAVLNEPAVAEPFSDATRDTVDSGAGSLQVPEQTGTRSSMSHGMTGTFTEEFPFPGDPATPARRSRMPIYSAAGLLVALICGAGVYLLRPDLPNPQTAAARHVLPAHPPVSAVPVHSAATSVSMKPPPVVSLLRDTLPSFIPKEGLDSTYGVTKPGWDRYLSPRREYLVFREKGVIRVLQVIALEKGAIDDAFLTSLLREFCGSATCVIKSRSERGGYIVEQGQTATRAEVVFYKKKGTGETRGIVISLP